MKSIAPVGEVLVLSAKFRKELGGHGLASACIGTGLTSQGLNGVIASQRLVIPTFNGRCAKPYQGILGWVLITLTGKSL